MLYKRCDRHSPTATAYIHITFPYNTSGKCHFNWIQCDTYKSQPNPWRKSSDNDFRPKNGESKKKNIQILSELIFEQNKTAFRHGIFSTWNAFMRPGGWAPVWVCTCVCECRACTIKSAAPTPFSPIISKHAMAQHYFSLRLLRLLGTVAIAVASTMATDRYGVTAARQKQKLRQRKYRWIVCY